MAFADFYYLLKMGEEVLYWKHIKDSLKAKWIALRMDKNETQYEKENNCLSKQ